MRKVRFLAVALACGVWFALAFSAKSYGEGAARVAGGWSIMPQTKAECDEELGYWTGPKYKCYFPAQDDYERLLYDSGWNSGSITIEECRQSGGGAATAIFRCRYHGAGAFRQRCAHFNDDLAALGNKNKSSILDRIKGEYSNCRVKDSEYFAGLVSMTCAEYFKKEEEYLYKLCDNPEVQRVVEIAEWWERHPKDCANRGSHGCLDVPQHMGGAAASGGSADKDGEDEAATKRDVETLHKRLVEDDLFKGVRTTGRLESMLEKLRDLWNRGVRGFTAMLHNIK